MKTLLRSCAFASALLAGSLTGSGSTVQGLKLVERVDPIFPSGVTMFGITKGAVRCVIDVDVDGRVEDVLIVAHTHEHFARAVKSVMPEWRFEPARVDGLPVPAQATLEITIEAVGVVTSMDISSTMMRRMETIWGQPYSFVAWTLKDLDSVPVPQRTVTPAYPEELAARNARGRVRVDFYIDESGAVRLPIVGESANPELSSLAIDAVRQWKFSPPQRHGRAVLVHASQEFNFNPKS